MFKFIKNLDINEYNKFINSQNNINFMQEPSWAKVKNTFDSIICGVYENDTLVAATQILVRKIKFGISLFYIPRGYVMDLNNKELLLFLTKNIKKLAKENHAYVIKIDPLLCNREYLFKDENMEFVKNYSNNFDSINKNFIECGYKHTGFFKEMSKTFQPRFQMAAPLIDKDMNMLTEEDFIKTLKSKHRYYLGEYHKKRGIEFEVTNDINRVSEFVSILKYTEKTQGINLRNEAYFKRLMENFNDRAYLIFGKINLEKYLEFLKNNDGKEDEINKVNELMKENKYLTVSTALLLLPNKNSKIKMSEYLYAGNNLEFNKLNISAGVCLEAINFSIKNRCHYCNLGGVDGNFKDHLSIYKSKFNALVLEFVGEYDLVVNKFIYHLAKIAYPILKKLKK